MELAPRERLVFLVANLRPAHHEHVAHVGLQLGDERKRAAEIKVGDKSRGVRGLYGCRRGKEHDRTIPKQLGPVFPNEVEREILHGNDGIETFVLVFQPQEVAKGTLVRGRGETCAVDVFRVVIEPFAQPLIDDSRELPFADGHDLRVSPGRVQHQNLSLDVLGKGGSVGCDCRYSGNRRQPPTKPADA